MHKEVAIFPYIVHFTIIYTVALLAFALATTLAGLNGGASGTLVALIAAVATTAARFVRCQQRVPTPAERRTLTWASLAASVLVSVLLVAVVLTATGQPGQLDALLNVGQQLGTGVVAGVLFAVLGVQALVVWIAYLGLARLQYGALRRKQDTA